MFLAVGFVVDFSFIFVDIGSLLRGSVFVVFVVLLFIVFAFLVGAVVVIVVVTIASLVCFGGFILILIQS